MLLISPQCIWGLQTSSLPSCLLVMLHGLLSDNAAVTDFCVPAIKSVTWLVINVWFIKDTAVSCSHLQWKLLWNLSGWLPVKAPTPSLITQELALAQYFLLQPSKPPYGQRAGYSPVAPNSIMFPFSCSLIMKECQRDTVLVRILSVITENLIKEV